MGKYFKGILDTDVLKGKPRILYLNDKDVRALYTFRDTYLPNSTIKRTIEILAMDLKYYKEAFKDPSVVEDVKENYLPYVKDKNTSRFSLNVEDDQWDLFIEVAEVFKIKSKRRLLLLFLIDNYRR